MKATLTILDHTNFEEYNKFVLRNHNFLWYVSLFYKNFFTEYLEANSMYYIVLVGQKIVGCLPLFEKQNAKYGAVLNSLPFYGSNGSFLLDNCLNLKGKNEVMSMLLLEVLRYSKSKNIAALTLITNPLDDFSLKFLEGNFNFTFKDHRIGQLTTLPETKETLIQVFSNPRPRNIRKAIKSNISIRISNSRDDFDFLIKTHQENMNSIGGKSKDASFFNLIYKQETKARYKLYVAEIDGKKVAALLLFYFNQTVEYFTPCTLNEFRNLQPSSLLIYEAMKDAIDDGYSYWNWGGTWEEQKGVYDFKKKWGAIDKKYYYYTKVFNKDLKELSSDFLLNSYPYFYTIPFKYLKYKS